MFSKENCILLTAGVYNITELSWGENMLREQKIIQSVLLSHFNIKQFLNEATFSFKMKDYCSLHC